MEQEASKIQIALEDIGAGFIENPLRNTIAFAMSAGLIAAGVALSVKDGFDSRVVALISIGLLLGSATIADIYKTGGEVFSDD